MERKYFAINEESARLAQVMNSFRDYEAGSATLVYKEYCDKAYDLVDKIAEQKPEHVERAQYMAERYCYKLANYYNAYYRNEASCPSVMISGAGHFPVRKKEKQNSRRESLMNEWKSLEAYVDKIENILCFNQPILSNDANVIERLQDKISDLEKNKELMKELNKYLRKHENLDDYEGEVTDELVKHVDFMIENGWKPYFDTTNTNAELRRLRGRLERIEKAKKEGTTETVASDDAGNEIFKVVKNTDIMRLQLIFDGKPDENVRDLLKKNGFRWSPKNGAWQRQLTDNALWSLQQVTKKIREIA